MSPTKHHTSWDDALPTFTAAMAAAPVIERTRMWNTLQAIASHRIGLDRVARLPWPQAWLHLTADDLLDVVTQPAAPR